MNELIESHGEGAFGPQVLDRLVDGELSEAQRREVLSSLDHRPEGWRQCALAFLEAQCWGQTLGQMARGRIAWDAPAEGSSSANQALNQPLAVSPSVHSSASSQRGQRQWARMMAMAASFLITLSLGMWVHQAWVKSAPGAGGAVVLPDGADAVVAETGSGAKYATMQFPEPNGGSRPVQLPLVEAQQIRSQPQMSAIPDGARQALAQAGLQFRVTREYHLAILNGRPVFVAVDRIDLAPAGNKGGQ